MKLHKLFFTILLLFASFQICFGQEKPKAYLFDEFGKVSSKEYKSRLDPFFLELNKNITSLGYVVFYGKKSYSEQVNLHNFKMIYYLTRFRKIDLSRVFFLRGKNQNKMLSQFWIVPEGAIPPTPDKKVKKD